MLVKFSFINNLLRYIKFSIFSLLFSFIFISQHSYSEVSNISGIVTGVEVLTANYIEEVPENRRVCQIQKVPITAQRKGEGVTDKKLFGAILGGVIGSKVGEGEGKTAATALGALIGSALSSGESLNSDKVGGAILGGVAGSQIGAGSGKNAAAAAGALIGSEIGNSNSEVIGYENQEVCEFQNVVVKKSINKVTGYRLNISADNRNLVFETNRSAQIGDVVSIRRTIIYDLR